MKQGLAAVYFPLMRESCRLQMPSDEDPLIWLAMFTIERTFCYGASVRHAAREQQAEIFNVFGKAWR